MKKLIKWFGTAALTLGLAMFAPNLTPAAHAQAFGPFETEPIVCITEGEFNVLASFFVQLTPHGGWALRLISDADMDDNGDPDDYPGGAIEFVAGVPLQNFQMATRFDAESTFIVAIANSPIGVVATITNAFFGGRPNHFSPGFGFVNRDYGNLGLPFNNRLISLTIIESGDLANDGVPELTDIFRPMINNHISIAEFTEFNEPFCPFVFAD